MPTWLTIFLALGGSAFISALVNLIVSFTVNSTHARKKQAEEIDTEVDRKNEVIRKGVQALLRNDLYALFDRCTEKGFATREEKRNFENIYEQYHALGQNGVMDNYRVQFAALPEKVPVRKRQLKEVSK